MGQAKKVVSSVARVGGLGLLGYQMQKSADATAQAKKIAEQQEVNSQALLDEANAKLASEATADAADNPDTAATESRNRRRALAAGASGRSSTILTGSLGLAPSTAATGGKTILGS